MIKLQGLNKFYNKGKPNEIHVINDITLDLPEKGMVAIFGKSGCGKTTLLNVIGGLDDYASGRLSIDGEELGKNTDLIRNKYVGYIFQNYNLNKGESCFDNVADALRLCGMTDGEQIKTRVMAALRNVGLENYHGRTPDTLSGGQQQRVAIARAIVKNPRIILADEPTGNLDDANTVMVMDLLKEISRDHLVLLVTHEANLVDYYCDTVVELNDGKVVGIKSNEAAKGYTARGKNDVYLGELTRTDISDTNACIEYYGDSPDSPVKLKIINDGGKLYIKIDTPKVQIIDESSEIKLKEGVYEEKTEERQRTARVDMSELPPVEGTRFGRLFSFGSAIKSGYNANFKKGKKGKKILRGCLCLFAAVIVFMSAVFGTSFSKIIDAKNSYNHNVFYVYTPSGDISAKLNAAVGKADTGIDYVRLMYDIPRGDYNAKFMTGFFESFSSSSYDESFTTNAVFLDETLIGDARVVAGRATELGINEMVITTRVADALIEKSSLGYIDDYESLVGLITASATVDSKTVRIVGVIESGESAVYFSELGMAKYILKASGLGTYVASEYDIEVGEGKAVVAVRNSAETDDIPKVGDTVTVHGKELEVKKVILFAQEYEEWLNQKGIKKMEQERFYESLLPAGTTVNDVDYWAKLDEVRNQRYFEYHDYVFAEFEEYLDEKYLFASNGDMTLWLYKEKGITEAKYQLMYYSGLNGIEYFKALEYKAENGKFPEHREFYKDEINHDGVYQVVEASRQAYLDEYNRNMGNNGFYNACLVSESDYIALSKQTGKTDAIAIGGMMSGGYEGDKIVMKESVTVIGGSMDIAYVGGATGASGNNELVYTVIHSNDPKATAEYLQREFSSVSTPKDYMPAILTPDGIFDEIISENSADIITGIIAMAVILVVMSVCMYFIMRSSLMNRIKEVGIYRAIGVSKKNLVFKFLIETLVLTVLTVLIGYLLTSLFLGVCLGMSSLMSTMLYYPVWLALSILAVLFAVCIFFGTLPITSLLRKTPSQILSKYDI